MWDFFDAGMQLDPNALRAHGLISVPIPEYPSPEQLAALAIVGGGAGIQAWHWEFGERPVATVVSGPDDLQDFVFKTSFASVFVSFPQVELYLWVPDGGEFYVLAGAASAVQGVVSQKAFEYRFEDYMNEPYFAGKRAQALRDVYDRYYLA